MGLAQRLRKGYNTPTRQSTPRCCKLNDTEVLQTSVRKKEFKIGEKYVYMDKKHHQ